jgi:succinoglycan biosynthesis protein ExoA
MTAAPPFPPLPAQPRVSVVIPALHAPEAVVDAIASALAQDPVFEVVVAAGDTATHDAAAAITDPRVRVIANPSGRTPDALNAAIDASRGQVLVRVDAHSVLPPGYVATAVDALRSSGAANVGGRQVPTATSGFARAVAAAMRSSVGAGGATYRVGGRAGPVDTVYLGVFRREAFDAVGGYDTRFTRNQDAELNLRLTRAGYTVWFEPSMEVAYRPRSSLRGLASQYLQYGRWRRLTVKTHPGSLAARQLAPPLLVTVLILLAVTSVLFGTPLPFALGLVGYVGALVVAGIAAAPALHLVPATALALGTMHVAWGVGFMLGPPHESIPADAD